MDRKKMRTKIKVDYLVKKIMKIIGKFQKEKPE